MCRCVSGFNFLWLISLICVCSDVVFWGFVRCIGWFDLGLEVFRLPDLFRNV